jgi:flagellar hook-length control protein FliK
MSATPLPSLPIASSRQHVGAPRPASPQHGGASFSAHLQSAQQQQTPPADSTQSTAQQTSDANQNDANAQAANANHADKPGAADASRQDDADNGSDIGIDLTGGAGALAHVVLNLIDHVVGDTHGGNATHAAPAKPAPQTGDKPANAAQPDALAAALIPTPLAVAMSVPAGTATGNVGAPGQGIDALSQKASAFVDANTSAAAAGDASHGAAPADGAAPASSNGDNLQTFAAGLAAIGHAAAPATSTDSTSQSSPDIAALGSLAAAVSAPPTSAPTGATHNLAMNAPVGSSGFAKELGQQITWLSGQDVKQAQIRLNPQDLGPLDVKVSVEHGRVDVSFMTQHPAATAAVQQGLDQLNQMLGGQGLSLGHATVGQQHAQQQFGAQQGQQGPSTHAASDKESDSPIATTARVAIGLVDAFA